MIHVGWLVAVIVLFGMVNVVIVVTFLRSIHTLVQAVIAKNSSEMVQMATTIPPSGPRFKRRIPEIEGEFRDPEPRPMGL